MITTIAPPTPVIMSIIIIASSGGGDDVDGVVDVVEDVGIVGTAAVTVRNTVSCAELPEVSVMMSV